MVDEPQDAQEPVELGEEPEASRSSKLPLVALVLALIGVLFGGAGIYMANQASQQAADLRAELQNRPDRTADLEAQLASIEERLVKMGDAFLGLQRKDREISQQVQQALDSVYKDMRTTRGQMSEQAEKVNELIAKIETMGTRPAAATSTRSTAANTSPSASTAPADASAPAAAESAETDGEAPAVAEGGVHNVQSGDTLSAIAKRYGISLRELYEANPGINPNRLQIGQPIVIPGQ